MKVALVTGSSCGVGKASATELYQRGWHVYISGRDAKRCAAAVADIKSESKKDSAGTLDVLALDLTDFASVRRAAGKLKQLDVLVLNAGVLYHGSYKGPWRTKSGHDHLFAANHLGHFLLCELLMPALEASNDGSGGRVVFLSSIAHWVGEEALFDDSQSLEKESDGEARFRKSYARSKLANLLHAYELQRRLRAKGSGVTVTPVAPGLVSTEIFNPKRGDADAYRHAPPVLQQHAVPPSLGAMTTVHAVLAEPPVPPMRWCVPYWTPPTYACLALSTIWEVEKSLELNQRRTWGVHVAKSSPSSYDAALAQKLWEYSEKAVGL